MTYEEKAAWLCRYQTALHSERLLAEEAERLRAEAERVTPLLTGMPGTGPDPDRLPRAVERILEVQQRLETQVWRCLVLRREVETAICAVQDERLREILRRRYILGQTLEKAAEAMMYDYRWTKRLHHRAVEQLAPPDPLPCAV